MSIQVIVGRRHQQQQLITNVQHSVSSSPSLRVSPSGLFLLRQPNNQRDYNAMQVMEIIKGEEEEEDIPVQHIENTITCYCVGHLPAALSVSLAPLIDYGCVLAECEWEKDVMNDDDSPKHADMITSSSISGSSISSSSTGSINTVNDDSSLDPPPLPLIRVCLSLNPSYHHNPLHTDRIRRHACDLSTYADRHLLSLHSRTERFISNFMIIAQSALDRDIHLLTDIEIERIHRFMALSREAKYLYCRLMQRKQVATPALTLALMSVDAVIGKESPLDYTAAIDSARWFRCASLNYKPISNIQAAIQELMQTTTGVTLHDNEFGKHSLACVEGKELDSYLPPPFISIDTLEAPDEQITQQPETFASMNGGRAHRDRDNRQQDEELLYSAQLQQDRKDSLKEETTDHEEMEDGAFTVDDCLDYSVDISSSSSSSPSPDCEPFLESSFSTVLPGGSLYSSLFECLPSFLLRELCSQLGIRIKQGIQTKQIKTAMINTMKTQRTLSGVLLVDDPRVRSIVHSVCGECIRLTPSFLLLCQRLYRLFFLDEDCSASSIGSQAAYMTMEDLGRVKWAPEIPHKDPQSLCVFPSRSCFLAYDLSLQSMAIMSFALDDFESEHGDGSIHIPLALACLEQAWNRVHMEHTQPNITEHCSDIDWITAHISCKDADSSPVFPSVYEPFFQSFNPYSPSRPASSSSSSVVPDFLLRFRAPSVYANVCYYGLKVLEKLHRYAEATTIMFTLLQLPYARQRRGFWWNRLTLNLTTHLLHKERALRLCTQGIQDEAVRTGEKVELQRRQQRLNRQISSSAATQNNGNGKLQTRTKKKNKKKKNKKTGNGRGVDGIPSSSSSLPLNSVSVCTIQGRALNRDTGSKSRFVGYDGELCSVEELALQYYASEAEHWHGVHCENTLFLTLFGILMWDCIFVYRSGVFHSRYQDAPLDLDTDDFYSHRVDMIEQQCQLIRSHVSLSSYLSQCYWHHRGVRCRGVNWQRWTIEQLQEMITCIGSTAMAGICNIIAKDYHHWQGGLPDLFLWSPAASVSDSLSVSLTLCLCPSHNVIVLDDDSDDENGDEDLLCIETMSRSIAESAVKRACCSRVSRVRLVEVKSHRDRLSCQQLAWLNVLAELLPVEVCYVKENAEK